jgi:hypothetical protein
VAGRSEDVDVAAIDFKGEEQVDPFEGNRAVDVEEVRGEAASVQYATARAPSIRLYAVATPAASVPARQAANPVLTFAHELRKVGDVGTLMTTLVAGS